MQRTDCYKLTEKDAFYLASIARMHPRVAEDRAYPNAEGAAVSDGVFEALRRAKKTVDEEFSVAPRLSLAAEIVADNRDYLDCLIDQIHRSRDQQGPRS